jgi:hypothetical protein
MSVPGLQDHDYDSTLWQSHYLVHKFEKIPSFQINKTNRLKQTLLCIDRILVLEMEFVHLCYRN